MQEIGEGTKVFDAAPVHGRWQAIESPTTCSALMDTGADGVVALVRDAGATFLAPIFHELTAAIVCTGGTPRSHIGIVSREFQVPCVMACVVRRRRSRPTAPRSRSTARGDRGVVRG